MRLWRRVETRARREKTAGEEQTACPRRPRCTIAVDKQRTNITSPRSADIIIYCSLFIQSHMTYSTHIISYLTSSLGLLHIVPCSPYQHCTTPESITYQGTHPPSRSSAQSTNPPYSLFAVPAQSDPPHRRRDPLQPATRSVIVVCPPMTHTCAVKSYKATTYWTAGFGLGFDLSGGGGGGAFFAAAAAPATTVDDPFAGGDGE